MPKLAINLLGWNHREEIGPTIESVLRQTFRDFDLVYTDNASLDGSAEFVRKDFPQVKVVANEKNLGYAGAHNQFFMHNQNEFLMVLNPDVELVENFLEEALKLFSDPKVAAVTGKMLLPNTTIIDGTGIVVSRARRARERGQHEQDRGQYDSETNVFGVSGTAAIYRRSALEAIRVPRFQSKEHSGYEYIDEDFFAYFDDLDLSWRFRLLGYVCKFAPLAIAYHARKASSSKAGYKKVGAFIKHHRNLSPKVKRWNWKNHLFCIIKNDFGRIFWRDFPLILIRELAMLFFILFFETRTLGAVPEFFSELPIMLSKRKYIQKHRKVDSDIVQGWFS